MKLIVHAREDLTLPLNGTPNLRFTKAGQCTYAYFNLQGALEVSEENPLTGTLEMVSNDGMPLNSFEVGDFLRYEAHCRDDGEQSTLMLTNDPIPTPVEIVPPTPEEILAQAKSGRREAINQAKEETIVAGVTVETDYGVETFRLEQGDRTLLLGIASMVQQGATAYPYHSMTPDNGTNICQVYSDADIGKIAAATFACITFHESYANMLQQWLERETDPEVVYGIEYGVDLPEDLRAYLGMVLASAGIDVELMLPPLVAAYEARHNPPVEETPVEESSEEESSEETEEPTE